MNGNETNYAALRMTMCDICSGSCRSKYRLGHADNRLFSESKKTFSGSKYPKNTQFNFETRSTEYTGNQAVMFYGYHLDNTIQDIAEAVYCLVPSLRCTYES